MLLPLTPPLLTKCSNTKVCVSGGQATIAGARNTYSRHTASLFGDLKLSLKSLLRDFFFLYSVPPLFHLLIMTNLLRHVLTHHQISFQSLSGALSIQQKSPVQIFGIFAGRMERVRPLPRTLGHVLCNTGHAG